MFVDGEKGERRCGLGCRQAVEAVLEDRVDVAVGAGADGAGARTSLFQPRIAVPLGQAQDAQAGAVPLLRMRTISEDSFDERGSVRADGAAPGDQPRGTPLQMLLMRLGHVSGVRGVPSAEVT